MPVQQPEDRERHRIKAEPACTRKREDVDKKGKSAYDTG